jgi:hypothetical protein
LFPDASSQAILIFTLFRAIHPTLSADGLPGLYETGTIRRAMKDLRISVDRQGEVAFRV